MDRYPQPRPPLYGTSDDEARPQTQTAPVRVGPPRYPPAPPQAGDAGGSGDSPGRRTMQYSEPFFRKVPWSNILAAAYALASLYAVYQLVFQATEFAAFSLAGRMFVVLQVVAALWVVTCLTLLGEGVFVTTMVVAAVQLVLGAIAGAWLSPGFWAAFLICMYLLVKIVFLPTPSPRLAPRRKAQFRQ